MSAIMAQLTGLLGRLGVPPKVAPVIVHAVIVAVAAFGAVLIKTGLSGIGWSVVAAGVAAAGSAVVHYLIGLVPNKPAPAPPAK